MPSVPADDMSDIEALLGDILDDKKPLPTPAKTVVNKISNAGPEKAAAQAVVAVSDDDFLANLMAGGDEPLSPADVAASTEIGGEAVLSEIEEDVTQGVTPGVFADTASRTNNIDAIKMPVFTADDFASTMDIRNFATLVTLNTSRWHAKVKDRQAGKDAATMGEADEASFEVRKRLLVGADDKLKAIHKCIDEARVAHYRMTLPWSTTSMGDNGRRTGGRLLPNTLFVEYTTDMAKFKKRMTEALDAFVPDYPSMIAMAKTKLGKRFNAGEYPNMSSIRNHFDLSFDFQPIPKGEDFGGLPKVQLDMLAQKVNDNTRLMAEHAMQDVWVRMRDAVAKMADRLATPDKLFHNTMVQHVRDVARLMAHLNVTGDATVEALRVKVEHHLCQHDADDLRKKPALRTQVGAMAASILQEMDA